MAGQMIMNYVKTRKQVNYVATLLCISYMQLSQQQKVLIVDGMIISNQLPKNTET